jgi:microcystin degradation protein MlrC
MHMRFITGGIMHETHTFSAEPTPESAWDIARGDQCWAYAGTNHSLGGVIDACKAEGIDLAPTFFAQATASGPVDRRTFEHFIVALSGGIAQNLPADGIVLTLHGALVAEALPDGELAIVRRVRSLVGSEMPIAVTLDLHANTSRELVDLVDIIVGYDTYPHVDINERAQEAVRLLAQTVSGELVPTMGFAAPPLLPVPQAMHTASHPFKTLFERVHGLESAGEAVSITLAGGFAYADTPAAGLSVITITNNDQTRADSIANEVATMAWNLRGDMAITNVPPADAVAQAIAWPEGPVILVDVGDNIGGGTPGDGTVLLRQLIAQGAREAVVVIADPESVQKAIAAGLGANVTLEVGGKVDRLHGDPVPVTSTVTYLGDGHWVHEGPENAGVPVNNGPVAIVDVDGVRILLESVKTAPGDLQQLKSAGIDPALEKVIVVKAAVRWRGGYMPITRHHIDVDTPGLGSVNLADFAFAHIRRPIFPLDQETSWP